MGGKDGQLLEATKNGNTSEALRLIEQKVANVNCTDSVRRSGEESTARALRVGRQGEEAAEAYSMHAGRRRRRRGPTPHPRDSPAGGDRLIAVAALVPPR